MSLRRNVVANYASQVGAAVIGLAAVPLYIRFLGIESYGIIGFFASLQALFALLDLGLGNAVNRELARLSGTRNAAREMRDLVRTLEIPYWAIGVAISIVIVAAAPWIGHSWLKVESLSRETAQSAVILMGICVGLRWPSGLYSGGLMGLQKQVLFNGLSLGIETLRSVTTLLTLWLVSPTLEAFFVCQALFNLANTLVLGCFLWASLPSSLGRARFRTHILRKIWRFAAGITGITLLSTVLMQLDKIVLSRLLSLENFGFYMLATVAGFTLYRLFGPIFSAVYPRFTSLIAQNAWSELSRTYHQSAQVLSVAVLPAAAMVVVFSNELMLIWTQDPVIAERTWLLVSILTTGTALNGLMHIPYGLQLAAGWTRLAFLMNLACVVCMVPLLLILTTLYGAIGAASVWVVLNLTYVVVGVQLMHRRLLKAEKWKWYLEDIGVPLFAASLLPIALKLVMPAHADRLFSACYIAVGGALTLIVTAVATPVTRTFLYSRFLTPHQTNVAKS
jgi:O-antigen/teichoic acid export membrane protein